MATYCRVKQTNRQLDMEQQWEHGQKETTHGPPCSMARATGAIAWQQRLHLLMSLFVLLP